MLAEPPATRNGVAATPPVSRDFVDPLRGPRDDAVAMGVEVVVWNLDARNRPELDVEIEIIYQPGELPGLHYARRRPELEVEIAIDPADDLEDLSVFAELDDDYVPIHDRPPGDYAFAYRAAADFAGLPASRLIASYRANAISAAI
jgi:hypothetical protein